MTKALVAEARKRVKTAQSEPEDEGDLVLSLPDVKKVDFDQIASVYSMGADSGEDLFQLTQMIVKKGEDNASVMKSAKELVARSKKQKTGPKARSGFHLIQGLLDAVRRKKMKKKVTKPIKIAEV